MVNGAFKAAPKWDKASRHQTARLPSESVYLGGCESKAPKAVNTLLVLPATLTTLASGGAVSGNRGGACPAAGELDLTLTLRRGDGPGGASCVGGEPMNSLFGMDLPTPVNFVIAFVVVLLLIMTQLRSGRWSKSILRRLEII